MRIILWLAAAAGATGLGDAALAQTFETFAGAPAQGGWSRGGHGPGLGAHRPARPGMGHGDDRRRRHHRRPGRDKRAVLYPFWSGIAAAYEEIDPHGNGFFAGGGGLVSVSGGRAYYDYDRSYPYEWASAAGGASVRPDEAVGRRPAMLCGVENGVRVCRGAR